MNDRVYRGLREQVESISKNYQEWLLQLAIYEEIQRSDKIKALDVYRKILNINPNHPKALDAVGRLANEIQVEME